MLREKEFPWSAALGAATRRALQGWPTWARRGGTLTGSLSQQASGKKSKGFCTQMIANRVKLQIQAWKQVLRRRARRGRTRSVAMSVSGDGGARCWRCRKLPARVAEQQRGGGWQLEVAGWLTKQSRWRRAEGKDQSCLCPGGCSAVHATVRLAWRFCCKRTGSAGTRAQQHWRACGKKRRIAETSSGHDSILFSSCDGARRERQEEQVAVVGRPGQLSRWAVGTNVAMDIRLGCGGSER